MPEMQFKMFNSLKDFSLWFMNEPPKKARKIYSIETKFSSGERGVHYTEMDIG